MCKNMDELSAIANQVYELEQKKAKKKKEVDYYKVLYTPFTKPQFDSKAFIANEEKGKELYDKYSKVLQMQRVTVKLATG